MNLSEFLKFNKNCPICDEPLTIYMQCNDNTLWSSVRKGNKYTFKPYKLVNLPFTKEDIMEVTVDGDDVNFIFMGSELKKDYKTWGLNFSAMCNKSGFNIKGNYAYDINPYYACYIRTTPWLEFKQTENTLKAWELNVINPDHEKLTNLDENFCFKVITNELEKVYMLNLDYESDKTRLWHYVVTAAQRDDEHYEPKLFEKEMPLMGVRPKFENKDKFIDRMDSWILIS